MTTQRLSPVTLIIAGLTAGGAERVLTGLANQWVAKGRGVTVVTWTDPSSDHYALDARSVRRSLGGTSESRNVVDALRHNLSRLRRLRNILREADGEVVISFGESMNVLCVLASLGMHVRMVVCERNDPRHHVIGRPWALARRLVYPLAFRLVVQTNNVREWATKFVPPAKVVVIPNAARDPGCEPCQREGRQTGRRILAAGRLVDQKGFDVLLQAFQPIADRLPDCHLTVLGEGPGRPALESLAERLGIARQVAFPGVVSDPERYMSESDVFVLSSRYEGFPNVLMEAMACGLAVISTDCPSGPSDIVRDGYDGVLVSVDDASGLSQAMGDLLTDDGRRDEFGQHAREVLDRFSADTILAKWDRVIDVPRRR